MAQSYVQPVTDSSELAFAEPAKAFNTRANSADAKEAYLSQKNRLLDAIDETRSILTALRQFSKDSWIVRYPHVTPNVADASAGSGTVSMRRSLSFADDPATIADVVVAPKREGLQRAATVSDVSNISSSPGSHSMSEAEALLGDSAAEDFHVLRLDLKLGGPGSSTSPDALVSQLEKASIAKLLDERIIASLNHIDKLQTRVLDTSSKVLVTGDLNAGKSTFVNALLHRDIMPVDQQPCTTLFCEVHDKLENDGVEEAHIVNEGKVYDRLDGSTFTRFPLSSLESVITESDAQHVLKLYVSDRREPPESLLNNSVVDICLIDAPGLNRDSLKTTALFARQEEIDVIVFVVSAENHFTLSAKEFLWNASNEKAYLFIVVNRFDQIKDKSRCRRLVLEQIKHLSPRTWDDAEDLVHFVDSNSALSQGLQAATSSLNTTASSEAFTKLETSLRSFVLVKRAKSKLMPASTYLTHILSDVGLLASANAIVAQNEASQARSDLERVRPILHKLQKGRDSLEDSLETEEEDTTQHAQTAATARLANALERVSRGEIAVVESELAISKQPRSIPSIPKYPGILGIWDYARSVRTTLLASLDLAVALAEDEARRMTLDGVHHVADLGEQYLPAHVPRSKRVFIPEAMFVPRLARGRRPSAIVAGGVMGLGLGLLAQREDLTQVTFVDIIDINHHIMSHFNGGKTEDEDDEASASALGTLGLGIGALTMVGGKTIGARGLIEGIVRISDLFGNESSRKWIAPVLGAATLGLTIYFVLELPNTIPKTVGRRIKASLNNPPSTTPSGAPVSTLTRAESIAQLPFAEAHAHRISRETRKVLRLASWDLRERFRGAMEESGREVKNAEESERRALTALEWFIGVGKRTEAVRVNAQLVS
ncbi:uncharacterized protein EI90DRAFT_1789362 [Cantharellus anzutake]|uniref:uncharacterized protein n=1 Tax=Cantharellus anzutake TaxID=1750568 RepID=UPI0019086770|nr:uncharacterized protein EI90DRAFT_1789362 [Cantharellus anzutake]KAF8327393.1 hypothetical protein EI90DRAFT_1789362 [Cantharellus anzutake]